MIFNFSQLSAYGQALKYVGNDIGELSKLTSKLTLEQTVNILSTKNLTKEQLVSILANKGMTQAEAEATAAKILSAQANGTVTFSLKAYTTALWANVKAMIAWMATNPIGWVLGLVGAVGVGVATYSYFNETIEEQKEKLVTLRDEYQTTIQDLEAIGNEIEANNERITELEVKQDNDTITLIEEDELDKLRLTNRLLKEKQDLTEEDSRKEATKLSVQNQATFDEDFGDMPDLNDYDMSVYHEYEERIYDGKHLNDKELILSISALYDGINNAYAVGDEATAKVLTEGQNRLIEILQERSSAILTGLLDYQNILTLLMNPDGTFANESDQQMWDAIELWKREIYKEIGKSGEWNTLQIDTVLNDKTLDKSLEEIEEKLVNGTLTEEDIVKYDNLNTALTKANLILKEGETPASIYLKYLRDIAISQDIVNSSAPTFTFDNSNNSVVDKYQSDLNSLSEALNKIRDDNLSSTDLLELLQVFPSLIGQTDNLSEAIQTLIDEELEDLKTTLKEAGANDEILALFDDITSKSKDLQLENMLSEIDSSYELVETMKEEMDELGVVSVATLQSIVNKYPKLEQSVDDYMQGLIDEKDILHDLQEEYNADLKNYRNYYIEKYKYDEAFYDRIVANVPENVRARFEEYKADLTNYTNLITAKAQLEMELPKKIYETVMEKSTGIGGMSLLMDQYSAKLFSDEEAQRLIDELMDTVDLTITLPNTSMLSVDDDKTDEFNAQIDWITKFVENAQQKVDAFDYTLSQTKGFQDRLDVYEDLKEANEELIIATENAAEEYKSIWEDKASKIDPKYIELITGDRSELKVENFNNEEEYNQVIAAMEAYDTLQSYEKKHNEALQKQKVDNDAMNSLYLEREEIALEILDLEDQDSMTVTEKNKWLEKEKQIKANILQYNLALAETDEERFRLEKEYAKYLGENAKNQYQNLKEERTSRVDYFGTKIQDIQNDIALEEARGGQGTETQYKQMNTFLDKQIAVYQQDYDEALAKRDATTPRTAEWYQYNQEIQDAQDGINDCKIAQLENNKAIKLLPVKYYEDLNKQLERELELETKNRAKIESAISYASTLVQDQIDLLNENKKSVTDYYDEQIEVIQKQKDTLTESNDEIQRQIDLENAKYNLEKALNNKTTRVYRKGQGFVYEANQDDVREAQQELDRQIYENEIASLDKAIDTLNKQKESEIEVIDKKIEAWEEYAEKINKVTSSYEKFISMQDFIITFGASAIEQVLSQDTSILTNFETTLNSVKIKEDELQAKIDANNLEIQAIQDEAEAYVENAKVVVEARQTIDEAVKANGDEIASVIETTRVVDSYGTTWTETKQETINALKEIELSNITAKDNENIILTERVDNLKTFKNAAVSYYQEIASAVSSAQVAFAKLQSLLLDNKSTYADIVAYAQKANSVKPTNSGLKNNHVYAFQSDLVDTYHDGGIVGSKVSSKQMPKVLMSLADSPLKPNETLAKLLNGEVILNNDQMSNLFNNLSNASIPLATNAITKNTENAMHISIGDVHVHNPDNADMIVNEIVKELPLKVIQKLNSK